MSLTVKSLLTHDEKAFAAALNKYLKDIHGTQLRVLYKTTPTAFVDPYQQDDEELRAACFVSVLDFVIVANVIKGHPRVAILCTDNPNRVNIANIFARYYLPIVVVSPVGSDFSQTLSQVKTILSQRPKVKFRGPSNSWEVWLKNMAEQAYYEMFEGNLSRRLDASLYPDFVDTRVFMEPCLAEFIAIPTDSDDPVHNYGRMARSDVLITKDDENLTPLLALEFDGPTHDRPSRQNSDKMKEALLHDAGIPLLRIRSSNVPFQLESSTGNVIPLSSTRKTSLNKHLFEGIFTKVIRVLTLNTHFEKIDLPIIWKAYDEQRRIVIEQKFSDLKRKYAEVIPQDVMESFLDDVSYETDDERCLAQSKSSTFVKSAFEDIAFFDADELLGITQSSLDIQPKNTQGDGGERRAILTTSAGTLKITVPRIDLQYFAPLSEHLYDKSAVSLSLLPENTFSDIVEQLTISTFHRLAAFWIEKSNVPKLITKRQLEQYREFWRRPRSAQEHEFLRACSVLEQSIAYQSLSAKDQAEIDAILNFDLDAALGLKPTKSIVPVLPVVTQLPTVYEYAEKFNRSPYVCLSYPGAFLGLIDMNADELRKRKEKRSLKKRFLQEEIQLAITAKSMGKLPRHLN